VLGIDPDERKIELARNGPGRLPNVTFPGRDHRAARRARRVRRGVICDVLYLLPLEHWRQLLTATARTLKPHGVLLLKEAEDDGSWRHAKTVLQEQMMVKLLGKTKGSGGVRFYPAKHSKRK